MANDIQSDPRSQYTPRRMILLISAILAVVLLPSMAQVSRRTSSGVSAHELECPLAL